MILVFIFLIFLLFISLLLSKNNFFSPGVITPGIWLICFCLFFILDHNLPSLSIKFLWALSLWVGCFCLFSNLFQIPKYSQNNYKPSRFIRDLYFIVSILMFPSVLFFAYKAILLGDSGNWAMDLRLAALGKSKHFVVAYGGWHIFLWKAAYLIELMFISKRNKWRVVLLALFYLVFGVLTMSKTILLDLIIITIVVLYFKEKIKAKYLLFSIIMVVFGFVWIQTLRHSISINSDNSNEFLVIYALSSMSAFDTLIPLSTTSWGENTFRFFYEVFYKLGVFDIQPVSPILEWIIKPIATNTYTIMYPFYKDFGFKGILIVGSLFGILYGYLFKKSQQKSYVYQILYAVFIPFLLFQYVGETFLTNFLGNMVLIVLLFIPFWSTKYKLFTKKHE